MPSDRLDNFIPTFVHKYTRAVAEEYNLSSKDDSIHSKNEVNVPLELEESDIHFQNDKQLKDPVSATVETGYPDENACFRENGKISGKRVRRCLKIFIVIILATFIPKGLSDIYYSSPGEPGNITEIFNMTPSLPIQTQPSCQLVNNPEDFKNLVLADRPTCIKVVRGYGLTSLNGPDEVVTHDQLSKVAGSVTSLDVDSRINEKWLELLLTQLKELNQVRIRINGLCEGACVKERSSLPSLELPNVTDLNLDSDSHWCDIITWIFKWRTPRLKTLTLNNIKFSKKTYNHLVKFLGETHEDLETITLKDCILCKNECDFINHIPANVRDKIKFKRHR